VIGNTAAIGIDELKNYSPNVNEKRVLTLQRKYRTPSGMKNSLQKKVSSSHSWWLVHQAVNLLYPAVTCCSSHFQPDSLEQTCQESQDSKQSCDHCR
jgi:hypothetical protein